MGFFLFENPMFLKKQGLHFNRHFCRLVILATQFLIVPLSDNIATIRASGTPISTLFFCSFLFLLNGQSVVAMVSIAQKYDAVRCRDFDRRFRCVGFVDSIDFCFDTLRRFCGRFAVVSTTPNIETSTTLNRFLSTRISVVKSK